MKTELIVGGIYQCPQGWTANVTTDAPVENYGEAHAVELAMKFAAAPEMVAALQGLIALANDPAGSTLKLKEVFGTKHCTSQIEGRAAMNALAKATVANAIPA